ncbi:MAG: MarR family transcriptional regulator [Deltaproteobacteria bacterium]|nr:MAG: MarR family transcriptional regulator [Deltaproteobacteria bacterium]
MDRKKTSKDIEELFIKLANKYHSLEKIPEDYGIGIKLYHSERHLIEQIGDYPEKNITELAKFFGVTKGAISQTVKKLENKGIVTRYKGEKNEKEVFLKLTKTGKSVYKKHKEHSQEAIMPLYEELKKYSDDKVYFLVEMFQWIDRFLDESKIRMQQHSKNKK